MPRGWSCIDALHAARSVGTETEIWCPDEQHMTELYRYTTARNWAGKAKDALADFRKTLKRSGGGSSSRGHWSSRGYAPKSDGSAAGQALED
jgi:hypothetical protein